MVAEFWEEEEESKEFNKVVMECSKCKLKFYASQLKLDPQTNMMVCTNCYNFTAKNPKKSGNIKMTVIKDRHPVRHSKEETTGVLTKVKSVFRKP
ncbi:hypothetical protein FJZ53_01920 [Candidatus Woesearchaeota archaeon]|nr:hypothetical protein [Candidatus Woesearchaeota archaeon]